ncbi:MAG: helix-turn-helix domain-containing protein [Armatimonadetes bacterium]|nr:helix-turn-helix domain-containing protein [Armatimonadota bacterium]
MKTENFDPLAYIESAFLDTNPNGAGRLEHLDSKDLEVELPKLSNYIHKEKEKAPLGLDADATESKKRFRKTSMSAPRPRRARKEAQPEHTIDPDLQEVWESLPKNIEFLVGFFDDAATANYYRGEFRESRQDLIRRLLDPQLTLEETSRLLGVVPATVRRYTNRGWLQHHRTEGGQRRFRLSDIVKFVQEHGRFPEE